MLFLVLIGCGAGCGQSQAFSNPAPVGNGNQRSGASLPIQETVDLGVVFQGQLTTFHQWIKNRSDQEILVERINVSCDCLSVQLSKKRIAPQGRVLVSFNYDGAKEPEFTGSLAIAVEFTGADRRKFGVITASIDVVKSQ